MNKPLPLDDYAGQLPISYGIKVLIAQATNENMRHCRIRSVLRKPPADLSFFERIRQYGFQASSK